MEAQIDRSSSIAMTMTTTKLYEAAINGDVGFFLNLLRQDRLILDRCLIENSSGHYIQSPLHVAAQMGHLEMVKCILKECPSMCLALDQQGRNPIHVAAIKGHVDVLEMVKNLINDKRIDKNAINKNNMTIVDIYTKQSTTYSGKENIKLALKNAKAKPAKDALNQQKREKWLEQQRTSLMVVASLIATMAFQVGINPPGGVWQDSKTQTDPIDGSPVSTIA
ncbi:Protein ACCELERATED CELL DEATH 6, partial [Bienertia sinuspersici]